MTVRTPTRKFWSPLVLMILASCLLAGCGKRHAPDFDLLPSQLTRDALDALANQGDALGADTMARLLTIDAEWPGVQDLVRTARDDDALKRAAAETEPTAALSQIDRTRSKYGSSDRLDAAAFLLMDLQRIERYCGQTWQRSTVAAAAFADLPDSSRLPSPAYEAWRKQEMAAISAMAEAERQRLVSALLQTLDRMEIAGDPKEAAAALQQLTLLAPEHPAAGGNGNSGRQEAAELTAFRTLRAGGTATPPAGEARTLCGQAAGAMLEARRNRPAEAIIIWRSLVERFPPADGAVLVKAIEKDAPVDAAAAAPTFASLLSIAQFLSVQK